MPGIGVQEMVRVGHDADMPLPEDEVSALKGAGFLPIGNGIAGPVELHVAIPGQQDARRLE